MTIIPLFNRYIKHYLNIFFKHKKLLFLKKKSEMFFFRNRFFFKKSLGRPSEYVSYLPEFEFMKTFLNMYDIHVLLNLSLGNSSLISIIFS